MVVKCQLMISVFCLNRISFLILILLVAVAGAFKNCSRSASLKPFHSAGTLRSIHFLFIYFSYLDFADLKHSSLDFLAVFMIFQGRILI